VKTCFILKSVYSSTYQLKCTAYLASGDVVYWTSMLWCCLGGAYQLHACMLSIWVMDKSEFHQYLFIY